MNLTTKETDLLKDMKGQKIYEWVWDVSVIGGGSLNLLELV